MSEDKCGKLFENSRQQMFTSRVEWEICQKIFPHLNRVANHGYPFDSKDKMLELYVRDLVNIHVGLSAINHAAAKMPLEYQDAFRYVAFREIGAITKAFLDFVEQRVIQKRSDRSFVASPRVRF
jgi:hypothetical protein